MSRIVNDTLINTSDSFLFFLILTIYFFNLVFSLQVNPLIDNAAKVEKVFL